MLGREDIDKVEESLSRQAVVALLGPRQVGKTTLALELAKKRKSLYLDLELKSDRVKLEEAELFLQQYEDHLVILDEIHYVPEIFSTLRGLIDQGRRRGKRVGRFLILGSASMELLKQSETLAGRIEYIELGPFSVLEVGSTRENRDALWLRGGFPESFLAQNNNESFCWRENFIRTYLERDVPQFGPRIPSEVLGRFWTMLAHNQGTLLNATRLASGLVVSVPTIMTYVGLLKDLLLVRRLLPYHSNVGKRMIKSPKTYIRDSGLLHALLNIENMDALLGHPIVGLSWEGFIIENLLSVVPPRTQASFYRTAAGAEIDLVLDFGGQNGVWAFEIKRSLQPKPEKGFHHGLEDLKPSKAFVVYAGDDRYPVDKKIEAIGINELIKELIKC